MSKKYKVVRLDNMATPIFSAKYFKDGAEADIENGNFVTIKELIAGEREVYKVEDVADADTQVGIICTPEFEYDERGYHGLDTFINKAGKLIRVKLFEHGAEFSVTDATYEVGTEYAVGTFKIVCDRIEQVGRLKYYMMRVL